MVKTSEQATQAITEYRSNSNCLDAVPAIGVAIDTQVLQSWVDALGERASEFLVNIIGIYFEDAAKLLQAMAAAIVEGDAYALEYQAHTLKSSSAALGATILPKLCQSLETMGRAGVITGATEFVLQICLEYQRVKAALQKQLQYHQAQLARS